MIKYFHELTKEEFKKLTDETWEDVRRNYRQPLWCTLPDAVDGWGCWSLISFLIRQEDDCRECEYKK